MSLEWLLEGVISHLAADGLKTLFAPKAGKLKLPSRKIDVTLKPILEKAIVSLAKTTKAEDKRQSEKLRLFLVSPEIGGIVRQIYASQLTDQVEFLEPIRAELLASLSLQLNKPEEGLNELAHCLFDLLLKACDEALKLSIDNGVLSAHEAKSELRSRLLLDELKGIRRNLDFLSALSKPDMTDFVKFEESYRRQVADRHQYIVPPNFDKTRKIPIDEVYVCPSFLTKNKEGKESEALDLNKFLSTAYRTVLLGNPGGGKSTFSIKFCHDLASDYAKRIFSDRQVTPVLVVLRDYGAEKKTKSCSILEFIEATAKSNYQVQPPQGAFEYMLLNGRSVVVFDGLDELLDTSRRQEISGDIESFCNLYPSVPVLVTSREVGYEQAPLDGAKFDVFRLSPFNKDQVREYVGKWFAVETDLALEQREQKIKAFVEESEIVSDLRANPLMLALMCNIYRGENYIPRNRPDVYEKCALMLFERWDKSRGIDVHLPFEVHVRPTMMYLAHWIYDGEALQGGVTENKLILKATEYLCARRFEDRDEAERAARGFIEFCRGRAWVFTEMGTTKEGERLYQFTHRTFLEYFCADHLARTHETTNKLWAALKSRIAKREWDVVAQLAFQIKNKNSEGAGDRLLTKVIEQSSKSKEQQDWNLLSFAARCLEFMVPSPTVTRKICTTFIQRYIAWLRERTDERSLSRRRHVPDSSSEPSDILSGLLNATVENRAAVASGLEEKLIELINEGDDSEALTTLDIGLHFDVALYRMAVNREPKRDFLKFWDALSHKIFDCSFPRIKLLMRSDFNLCYEAFIRETTFIENVIAWHGLERIFQTRTYITFPDIWSLSIADWLINAVMRSPHLAEQGRKWHEYALRNLKVLGGVLLSARTPWWAIEPYNHPMGFTHWLERPQLQSKRLSKQTLDSEILFGIFSICATLLEVWEQSKEGFPPFRKERSLTDAIKKSDINILQFIRWIFIARFESVDGERIAGELQRCGFNVQQQAFISQWISREINLVAVTGANGAEI